MWFTETHNCDFPQFLRVRERPDWWFLLRASPVVTVRMWVAAAGIKAGLELEDLLPT